MHETSAAPEATKNVDPIEVLGAAFQELPCAYRAIFQGGADARAAAARVWAPGFSNAACRANTAGTSASLWLGPDEVLLISASAIEFGSTLAGVPHSLVDVSHRQIAFELSGPTCTTLLSGGCPLDLDLTYFPIGTCTRTLFAKTDIVLWRKANDVFHVEVWRSFFDYTTQLLAEMSVT